MTTANRKIGKPFFASFYSFKGGTGRTMALANAAYMLAKYYEKKVVIVDWDLEGYGVHYYFNKEDNDFKEKDGLVEYLIERTISRGTQKKEIGQFLSDISDAIKLPDGSVRLLHCGRLDKNYYKRMRKVIDRDFLQNWHEDISDRFREDMHSAGADIVLIDSRAGLSYESELSNFIIPNIVFFFVYSNEQSIETYRKFRSKIKRINPSRDTRLDVFPILSRVFPKQITDSGWLGNFQEKISKNFFVLSVAIEYTVGENLIDLPDDRTLNYSLEQNYRSFMDFIYFLYQGDSIEDAFKKSSNILEDAKSLSSTKRRKYEVRHNAIYRFISSGNLKKAENYCIDIIELKDSEEEEKAYLYLKLGIVQLKSGNKAASDNFEKAAKFYENSGDLDNRALIYEEWGDALKECNYAEEAKKQYENAKTILQKNSARSSSQKVLNRIDKNLQSLITAGN